MNVLEWAVVRRVAGCSLFLLPLACESPSDSMDLIVDRWAEHVRCSRPYSVDEEAADTAALLGLNGADDELLKPGVLELERAREIALQANPDIHAARARLEAAQARIAQARSSFLPRIEIAHNTNRTFLTANQLSRLPTGLTTNQPIPELPQDPTLVDWINAATSWQGRLFGNDLSTTNTNSFSDHTSVISVGWTVFDGFVREARLLSTKHQQMAYGESLADAERLLVQAVDAAYHRWHLGREQLRVARADEQFSREQLADAERKLEARKLTKAAVLNFEVRVRAAQTNVVTAIGVCDTARVILAELMALPDSRMPDGFELPALEIETEEELAAPDAEEWICRALVSRPDLTRLEHVVAARREGIMAAKGEFGPELSLQGSWGFERQGSMAYSEDDQSSIIALEMRWAVTTGGLRTAQLREANAVWWEAVSELKRKRLEVAADVRQAVVDLVNAQEQVRLQRVNLSSAEENRRLVRSEYAAGKASLVRLNEAQQDYVRIDGELARSRVNLRQAWSDLHAATGVLPDGLTRCSPSETSTTQPAGVRGIATEALASDQGARQISDSVRPVFR